MATQAILTTSKASETGTWAPSAGAEETAIRTAAQYVRCTAQGQLKLRGDWTAPAGSTVNTVTITVTVDGQETSFADNVVPSLRVSVNGTATAVQNLTTISGGTNPAAKIETKTFTGPWTAEAWNGTDTGAATPTFWFQAACLFGVFQADWYDLTIEADYTPAAVASNPGARGLSITQQLRIGL